MDTSKLSADSLAAAVAARLVEFMPRGDKFVTPEYLTAAQVSLMTGFSMKSLETFRAKRVGPRWIRVGSRCVRYPAAGVREWIEAGGPV